MPCPSGFGGKTLKRSTNQTLVLHECKSNYCLSTIAVRARSSFACEQIFSYLKAYSSNAQYHFVTTQMQQRQLCSPSNALTREIFVVAYCHCE